jgi:hypothetical protein
MPDTGCVQICSIRVIFSAIPRRLLRFHRISIHLITCFNDPNHQATISIVITTYRTIFLFLRTLRVSGKSHAQAPEFICHQSRSIRPRAFYIRHADLVLWQEPRHIGGVSTSNHKFLELRDLLMLPSERLLS